MQPCKGRHQFVAAECERCQRLAPVVATRAQPVATEYLIPDVEVNDRGEWSCLSFKPPGSDTRGGG